MIKYTEYDNMTLKELQELNKTLQIKLENAKNINETIELIHKLGKINFTIGTKTVRA